MKLLLSHNCDINERNSNGSTPLLLIVQHGSVEDIELLIAFGANVHLQNYFGESVVHSAAANDDPALCRHLLHKYKLNVNERCMQGLSPLHIAARCGNTDVATELIEWGARVNIRSIGGRSPLYYAVENKRNHVIRVLLENGADINSERKERDMILRLAVDRRSKIAARLMVKHLARLEATGVAINPLNMKLIEQKEELLELLGNCRDELRAMKEKKLFNRVSFFHILVGSRDVILGYARNEELIKNFEDHAEEFRIYESVLRSKVNWALNRDKFQQCVSSILCGVLPLDGPQHLVIQRVVQYLNEDDLPNWQRYEKMGGDEFLD